MPSDPMINVHGSVAGIYLSDEAADAWAEVFEAMARDEAAVTDEAEQEET